MKQFMKVLVYLRFSTDGQSDGHSFERQRELAKAYLRRKGIDEAKVEWIEDPAFSAFHGEHIKTGALGKLMRRVREKLVSDSLLIFESVDRASREGGWKLLSMLNELLEAGFAIYFLDQPETEPFDKQNQPHFLSTYISIRAEIARLESERKSDFSEANWKRRRELAREQKVPFTAECPSWLKVENGRYQVDFAKVASIQTVFELARDGWGVSKIVRFANQQEMPVPGKGNKWHLSLLNRLFANKALVGEFQPHVGTKSRRKPFGDPIPDYYPVVIAPELFYSVKSLREKASKFPHRRDSNNYNYLIGLGRCECGGTWRRLNKQSGKQRGYAQYSCSNRQLGASDCKNLPGRVFDYFFIGAACAKIPSLLTVVDSKREAKKAALEGQLVDLKRRIFKLVDLYESDDTQVDEVKARLAKAKKEQIQLQDAIAEIELHEPPEGEFDFGDAVTAYLPAFLDVHDEESTEAHEAFRARALFRTRLIQSVESVIVNNERTSMKVRLKNGVEFEQEIRDVEFGPSTDLEEEEIEKTAKEEEQAREKLFA